MRHGRAKAARKTLQFFQRTYGYRPPYHILIDGTLVATALKFKIPLYERLETLLQQQPARDQHHSSVLLYCPTAAVNELQQLQAQLVLASSHPTGGGTGRATTTEAKAELLADAERWLRQHATLLPSNDEQTYDDVSNVRVPSSSTQSSAVTTTTSSETEDLAELTSGVKSAASRDLFRCLVAASATSSSSSSSSSSSHHHHRHRRYILATQDEELLNAARKWGRSPIVRLAAPPGNALLLERPSKAAQRHASKDEYRKWGSSISGGDATLLENKDDDKSVKDAPRSGDLSRSHQRPPAPGGASGPSRLRRKTKAKGPNPLSCRRRQNTQSSSSSSSSPQRPTKRPKCGGA